MSLTVTPNEHHTKILRVRDRVRDLVTAPKPLPGGDYLFEAHGKVVVIEVKWSLADLFDSLQVRGEAGGPRLGVEVRKMLAYADVPIVLTPPIRDRGDGFALRDDGQVSGWQYSSVKGILTDVALYGCIVDEWDGDIAQRIASYYYTLTKQEHNWIQQRGRPEFVSLDPLYTEAVWMLCSVYGWGPEAAQQALQTYGSVRGVVGATPKELQRIRGVGPKMGAHFEEVVGHSSHG